MEIRNDAGNPPFRMKIHYTCTPIRSDPIRWLTMMIFVLTFLTIYNVSWLKSRYWHRFERDREKSEMRSKSMHTEWRSMVFASTLDAVQVSRMVYQVWINEWMQNFLFLWLVSTAGNIRSKSIPICVSMCVCAFPHNKIRMKYKTIQFNKITIPSKSTNTPLIGFFKIKQKWICYTNFSTLIHTIHKFWEMRKINKHCRFFNRFWLFSVWKFYFFPHCCDKTLYWTLFFERKIAKQ